MNEVFSREKMIGVKFLRRSVLSLSAGLSQGVGHAIHMARTNSERSLAREIAKDGKFVSVSTAKDGFIEVVASAIVLTENEYEQLCRTQFMAGRADARGYIDQTVVVR